MNAKLLNPLQIFKNNGLADVAEPVDYQDKDILFWHVPELIEKNDRNLPAHIAIPSKDGQNRHDLRNKRRDAMLEYMYNEEQIDKFINDKFCSQLWRDDASNSEDRIKEFYEKLAFLLQNSSTGRIGSHSAGLYFDCSKIVGLFSMKFSEAERIVDNNLAIANAACIYAAVTENHEKTEVCEDAKNLFKRTLRLAKNPKVHLRPMFCVADVQDDVWKDETGKPKKIKRVLKRVYVEDDVNLNLQKGQSKLSLQQDLREQFNEVKRGEHEKLDVDAMVDIQRATVKKAEQKYEQESEF